MINKNGTPKSLEEAISNAINHDPRPLTLETKLYQHVRDFISQKFGIAYLSQECVWPNTEDLLKTLFESLTRREK